MKTRFAIVTALVFALALFLGAMTGLAQDESSGQPDQGMENTPGGGGTSNTPKPYEHQQVRGASHFLLAEGDNGGGMENTPGGGTSNTPGSYEHSTGSIINQQVRVAQMEGGGMENAPGATAPTLTDDKTGEFTAASKADAQKMCDQVAAQNGKSSCTAEAGTGTNMWYCDCK
ncbi:MAG: hypothetical protein M0Z75_09205 [Nitrospiraceae bacterium]|nr:hypothetical protein [Nitrospiraceae bacterium]